MFTSNRIVNRNGSSQNVLDSMTELDNCTKEGLTQFEKSLA